MATASIERLSQALKNAHAAGDTEAAAKLAATLRSAMGESPAPRATQYTKDENGEVRPVTQSDRDAVDRRVAAQEVESMPWYKQAGESFSSGFMDMAGGVAQLTGLDDAFGISDELKQDVRGRRMMREAVQESNPWVGYPSEIAGNILAFAPLYTAAPGAGATTLGGRIGYGAAMGAAEGAGRYVDDGESRLANTAIGTLLGGAADGLLFGGAKAWKAGTSKVPGTEAANQKVVEAGRRLGYSDEQLKLPEVLEKVRNEVRRSGGDLRKASEGMLAEGDSVVPKTRAEATGNGDLRFLEEQARQGVLGDRALKAMQEFDEYRMGILSESVDRQQAALSGGVRQAENLNQAGYGIIEDAAEALKGKRQLARESYDKVGDVSIAPDDYVSMLSSMKQGLADANMSGTVHDQSMKLNNYLDEQIRKVTQTATPDAGALADQKPLRFGINAIDDVRDQARALRNAPGTTDADRRVLNIAMDRLDRWQKEAAEKGVLIGDEGALDRLKASDKLYSEYKSFTRKDTPGGKVLERILQASDRGELADLSADSINRSLFGAANKINPNKIGEIQTFKRLLGEDSPGFNKVREAVYLKLFAPTKEASLESGQESLKSAQRYVTRVKQALTENKDVLSATFKPEEIDRMRGFADEVEKILTPSEVSNNSRSGWVMQRAMDKLGQNTSTMAGVLAGDATGTGAVIGGGAAWLASQLARIAKGGEVRRSVGREVITEMNPINPYKSAVTRGALSEGFVED